MSLNEQAHKIYQLRQELAELRDPGAHDGPGHALYLALKRGLEEDLALLGADPCPTPSRPVIRLSSPIRPKPAQAVAVSEAHPTEILPAEPVEMPMDQLAINPQEKLDHMMEGLRKFNAKGRNTGGRRYARCGRHPWK